MVFDGAVDYQAVAEDTNSQDNGVENEKEVASGAGVREAEAQRGCINVKHNWKFLN